jgi:hypothetical protein
LNSTVYTVCDVYKLRFMFRKLLSFLIFAKKYFNKIIDSYFIYLLEKKLCLDFSKSIKANDQRKIKENKYNLIKRNRVNSREGYLFEIEYTHF